VTPEAVTLYEMFLKPALRVVLLFASYAAAFGQINASSGTRPVSLEMQENDGALTFSLRNEFRRVVSRYRIKVWAFDEDNVPKLVCGVRYVELPFQHMSESRIVVPNTCTLPRDRAGNLRRFTAKLASVDVDGRALIYETMRVNARP
jgi:hypothetical protein